MTNVDTYLQLERQANEAKKQGQEIIVARILYLMDDIWKRLTQKDRRMLNTRKPRIEPEGDKEWQ